MNEIISIVVPVYNAEKYLDECIESVLGQTDDRWELILVDDGSKDKSGQMCDAYAKKYPDKIKVFHNENHGQFYSRTFGAERSSGYYIGFLDSDDFLDSVYIEKLQRNIFENSFPDVICFGFSEWNGEVQKTYVPHPLNGKSLFNTREAMMESFSLIVDEKMPNSMCAKLFRTEFIKNVSISNNEVLAKRYGEDAFQSRYLIFKAKSLLLLETVLYFYRYNSESASYGFDYREFDYFNSKYVLEMTLSNLATLGMDTEENHGKILSDNFNSTVYFLLKYYRSAGTKERRRAVINYDWSSYLLDGAEEAAQVSTSVRKSYLKIWRAFKNKKYLEIAFREKFKKYIGW